MDATQSLSRRQCGSLQLRALSENPKSARDDNATRLLPRTRSQPVQLSRQDRQVDQRLCEILPSPCNRRNRGMTRCAKPCFLNPSSAFADHRVPENVRSEFQFCLTNCPAPLCRIADNVSIPANSGHRTVT